MTTSDSINELASALAKAQGEMGGAAKDSANPFYKSRYASLDSVWDACRGPLAKYEIAVVQSPSCDGTKVSIDTLLIHRSGQWMRGTLSVTAADDSPQAVGSAVTYGRRYALQAFGTAREGKQSSSFNYAGGTADDLRGQDASAFFGLADMLRDTERQIHTRPVGANFIGDVVLMPNAAANLVQWLLAQIGDIQLIAGSSLYRERVGDVIASPLLALCSRFDAPGSAALSSDAFVTPPVEILRDGRLVTLTPSLYGSRKTGIAHVPTRFDALLVKTTRWPSPLMLAEYSPPGSAARPSLSTEASTVLPVRRSWTKTWVARYAGLDTRSG